MLRQLSQQNVFDQLYKLVLKYSPSLDDQEIKQILKTNGKSLQQWKQYAGDNVMLDQRQSFLKQLNGIIFLKPIVNQYFAIKPHSIVLKKISGVQFNKNLPNNNFAQKFNEQTQERIKKCLAEAKNVQQYLLMQINHIIDILQIRYRFNIYFKLLAKKSKQHSLFSSTFGDMTIIDFIIILQKFTQPKDIISFLLAQQNAPVPFSYNAINQSVTKDQLLLNITRFKKYRLILNIWSENSRATLQRKNASNQLVYFSQAIAIDPIYFEGSNFDDVISFYKLNYNNQTVLFVDYLESNSQEKNKFVISLFEKAALTIFHIDSKDLQKDTQNNFIVNKFLSNYKGEQIKRTNTNNIYFCEDLNGNQIIGQIKKIIDKNLKSENIFRTQKNQKNQLVITKLKLFKKNIYSILSKQIELFVSLNNFSEQSSVSKKQSNYNKIIDFLDENRQKYKQDLLPKIFLQNQLNIIRAQIKNLSLLQFQQKNKKNYPSFSIIKIYETSQVEYIEKIKSLTLKQNQYKEKLQQISISSFLQDCKPYLKEEEDIQIQEFIYALIEHQNEKISLRLREMESRSKEAKRSIQYKNQKKRLLQNRISIDNIINQYSVYNQLTIDKRKLVPSSIQQRYINQYYTKCLNNQNPFNIIDGEQSNFGNQSLLRFFESLYKNKQQNQQIFVISVLGSKSSGKSTLINYLFHYNIHMKEDQFARGVYVGLCQISNFIIVLLDTSGIMEIDFQNEKQTEDFSSQQLQKLFAAFDHQIASLIMKVSDLVILTGFAEILKDRKIPKQIELVVGICYKVLDAIHSNNDSDNKYISPTKIMFALNKTNKSSLMNKKEAISLMMNNLKPILSIHQRNLQNKEDPRTLFQKYMRLQAQDIFELPAIDNRNQANQYDIISKNENFALTILEFRSRILNHLDKIKNHRIKSQKMRQIYMDSKANWQIIILQGKKIIKTQSITDSYQRQTITQIYHEKYPQIYSKIVSQIQKILPATNSKDLQISDSKLIQLIKDQKGTFTVWSLFSSILNQFLTKKIYFKQGDKKSNYQKIIQAGEEIFSNEANKKINKLQLRYSDLYIPNIKRVFDTIIFKKVKQYFDDFQTKFQNCIETITFKQLFDIIIHSNIEKRKNTQERNKIYTQMTDKILNAQYLKQAQREKISQELIITFQSILSSENIFIKELQIKHIKDCLDFDNKINNKYIDHLEDFLLFQDLQQINQQSKAQLAKLIELYVRKFQNQLITKFDGSTTQIDIKSNFLHIKEILIDVVADGLSDNINQRSQIIYQNTQIQKKAIQLIKSIQLEKTKIDNQQLQQAKKRKDEIEELLKTQKDQKLMAQLIELNQNIGFLQRQSNYLVSVIDQLTNFSREKISLGKIKFKILLISKMFKKLQDHIYQQRLNQIHQLRQKFKAEILSKRALIDKKINESQEAIDQDIVSLRKNWLKQYQQKLVSEYKNFTKQTMKGKNKEEQRIKIQSDTIHNPNLQNNEIFPQDRRLIYIQCFKYVTNPSKYMFQKLLKQLSASSYVSSIISMASQGIKNAIQNIVQFKPLQATKDVLSKFIKDNTLIYISLYNEDAQALLQPGELVEQFRKTLQLKKNSIFDQMKNSSYKNEVIEYITTQITRLKNNFLGCQQTCPFCGAICRYDVSHPGNHSAVHTSLAFGCCRDQLNQLNIKNCWSGLKNIYWSKEDKLYRGYKQMIEVQYRSWSSNFVEQDKRVENKYWKICANIDKAMLKIYKDRFKVTPNSIQPRQSTNQKINEEKIKKEFINDDDLRNNPRLLDYWEKA